MNELSKEAKEERNEEIEKEDGVKKEVSCVIEVGWGGGGQVPKPNFWFCAVFVYHPVG